MTTINVSTPSVQSGGGTKAASGNSLSAQIAQIAEKITQLTQKLKEVPDGSGSAEEEAAGIDTDSDQSVAGTAGTVTAPAGRRGPAKAGTNTAQSGRR